MRWSHRQPGEAVAPAYAQPTLYDRHVLRTAVYMPPTRRAWTAVLATRCIRAQLAERPDGGDLLSFVPVIADMPERAFSIRAAIAATLVASLELARDGEIGLDQPRPAAPLRLRPRPRADATSADKGALSAQSR